MVEDEENKLEINFDRQSQLQMVAKSIQTAEDVALEKIKDA